MLRISTVNDHQRMSTQTLLQTIAEAVAKGETEIHVSASGQHDIGGPLWNDEGKTLHFTITNPGQRVGSMCMPNTSIVVEGPAPADAGWLNAGGTVTIRGDAGDTAGHCAAGGKIYIGGRAGTRSGSLMKHDPDAEAPELWILNSTGSFSFEFMGGGKAIVCGHNSQTMPSVLGERPCVGMVGGVIYFRGPYKELSDDVEILPLDEEDQKWLDNGLDQFLAAVNKSKLKKELSLWKHWHKLVPANKTFTRTKKAMSEFHQKNWFDSGIFGDVLKDDLKVIPLVNAGADKLAAAYREDEQLCTDCKKCLRACPQAAIKRRTQTEPQDMGKDYPIYTVNLEKCIGCGICAAICPEKIWKLRQLI